MSTSDLQLFGGSSDLLLRDARRTSRAVSRYQSGGQLRTALVDIETDVSLAKVDALTAATGHGMGAVVRVAQGQRHLELLAPEASIRLNYLADDHALGVAEVLAELRRDLRRR